MVGDSRGVCDFSLSLGTQDGRCPLSPLRLPFAGGFSSPASWAPRERIPSGPPVLVEQAVAIVPSPVPVCHVGFLAAQARCPLRSSLAFPGGPLKSDLLLQLPSLPGPINLCLVASAGGPQQVAWSGRRLCSQCHPGPQLHPP